MQNHQYQMYCNSEFLKLIKRQPYLVYSDALKSELYSILFYFYFYILSNDLHRVSERYHCNNIT